MRYLRRIIVILFVAATAASLATAYFVTGKKDTTAPVITCDIDELEVTSDASEEELLAGLQASDNRDGDLTDKILIGSHSKFIEKGVCKVTYLVFDSSYNAGQYTRKVKYTDYTSPKFALSEPFAFDTKESVTMLDKLKVYDAIEGDISNKVKIVSSNIKEGEEGTYSVEVEAANDYADVVSIKLPVHIDARVEGAPAIQLETYLVYVKTGEEFDPYQYLTGVSDADGNPMDPAYIQADSSVDISQPGTYEVTYSYTDVYGRTGYSYLTVAVTE